MEVRLTRLTAVNFKSHRFFEVVPHGGCSFDILGDNATGKTSFFDAMTWGLLGVDSLGRGDKVIEVKPLNADGEVADHEAETSVEVVLAVDGEEITFKRTLQEVWTTKRGELEPVFTGNASSYYIDGVPVKANAYKERFEEIISPELWKLLTDVYYFNELHWTKKREILFKLAGTMTDQELMQNKQFAPLAEALGKLSVEDGKAKWMAEKKQYTGARNELPARIDEAQHNVKALEGLDFEAARAAVERLNARLDAEQTKLAQIENDTAVANKQMELREAQLEMDKLESENKAFRASQQTTDPNAINILKNQIAMADRRAESHASRRAQLVRQNETIEVNISACRAQWMETNSRTFTTKDCPVCGQKFPADQIRASQERFETEKKQRLREIEAKADEYKALKKTNGEAFEEAVASEQAERATIAELQAQLAKLEGQTVTITDMADYNERKAGIQDWIKRLQDELFDLRQMGNSVANDVRQEIHSIKQQIAEQQAIIGKRSVLAFARERMEQLRQEASEAAKKLSAVEKLLHLVECFGRYKANAVTDAINSKFEGVEFRLYKEQINGGLADCAEAVVDGVPYPMLNSGAKINTGLRIISALSEHYGLRIPLMCDNAESVTKLAPMNTQVIRLVVSENDKTLRVVYHNS